MQAGIIVWLGAMGVAIGALNICALHAVRIEDVPRCVQGRIRWWSAHNAAFLLTSAALVAIGLGARALT